MKGNNNYDEKQIIDRGKAFQYGFIAAMLTICGVYFYTDALEFKMDSYAAFLIRLWIPITITFIVLIVKDAYDGANSTPGRIILTVLGMAGLFLVGVTVIRIVSGKEVFLDSGTLTDSAGRIFSGICMILVSIIYWVKQYLNSRKFKDQ